ncbi:MAG: hypothetical protein AUG44_17435 [Actinobacteria bacterium 13_1_20CM_3_71_11]|nr:MAG: hypothetical protein AUG44_17435 [Actinobacteria bacterium 13_1_20CM_3_71_11]
MRCPSCGLDVDQAHALCPRCGTQLPLAHSSPQWGAYGSAPGYGAAPPGAWTDPQQATPHGPWPAGPYEVLEPGTAPARRRPAWAWLVAVLAVIFLSAAGAGVILKLTHKLPRPVLTAPGGQSTLSSAPDGRGQAATIDALLNASGASRTQLGPALTQVENCGDLDAAAITLQKIMTERNDQVRQSRTLAVDQLDHGTQLRDLLAQALTHSLEADQKFAAWLQNAKASGCTGHAAHDADYQAAQAASSEATNAKLSFVQLWNPIASRYGLPVRSDSTF